MSCSSNVEPGQDKISRIDPSTGYPSHRPVQILLRTAPATCQRHSDIICVTSYARRAGVCGACSHFVRGARLLSACRTRPVHHAPALEPTRPVPIKDIMLKHITCLSGALGVHEAYQL